MAGQRRGGRRRKKSMFLYFEPHRIHRLQRC